MQINGRVSRIETKISDINQKSKRYKKSMSENKNLKLKIMKETQLENRINQLERNKLDEDSFRDNRNS